MHGVIAAVEAGVTARPSLGLLQGFELRLAGQKIDLPMSAQRLMAFLALHNRPLQRAYVAGSLWLDCGDERAGANLRSSLWRLHRHGHPLVRTVGTQLEVAPEVRVDLHEAITLARSVLAGEERATAVDLYQIPLWGDLLPDWYDDWVLIEREHFRQLRLHALEALAQRLTARAEFSAAVEAGLAAIAAEPLRESAHRTLIRTYAAEGNVGEALHQYRRYADLVSRELGVQPSAQMEELVRELRAP
jgi:DNA-binding SARP family transcriptional activator